MTKTDTLPRHLVTREMLWAEVERGRREGELLREVGKHIESASVTLPFELAAKILRWYRESPNEPAGDGYSQEYADGMRTALLQIQQWDCLNPPRAELLADLPWLRRTVDQALLGLPVKSGGEG